MVEHKKYCRGSHLEKNQDCPVAAKIPADNLHQPGVWTMLEVKPPPHLSFPSRPVWHLDKPSHWQKCIFMNKMNYFYFKPHFNRKVYNAAINNRNQNLTRSRKLILAYSYFILLQLCSREKGDIERKSGSIQKIMPQKNKFSFSCVCHKSIHCLGPDLFCVPEDFLGNILHEHWCSFYAQVRKGYHWALPID